MRAASAEGRQGRRAVPTDSPRIGKNACLVDLGSMADVTDWLKRARTAPADFAVDDALSVWVFSGAVAYAVLAGEAPAEPDHAAGWLLAQLQPLRSLLSADERLIVAQVLVNQQVASKQFERFDLVANAVAQPALFDAASPVMRARWLHTFGFVQYQIGNIERAEVAFQRALELASEHNLVQMRLLAALAMLRLSINHGRLEEAERIEAAIQPQWGAGREQQLIEFKRMSARLQILRGQPVRALATLREALALAEHAGFSMPDRAAGMMDLWQVLVANQKLSEAEELLQQLAREYGSRDGDVFRCVLELLRGWRGQAQDENASRAMLAAGLRRAQENRYMTFFRLLPWVAAEVCAQALRWNIEPVFAAEVIRARGLQAPADADERWPWLVYLRLLGGIGMRLNGKPELHEAGRKVQKKPMELLRALACAPELALSATAAADALWPDAAGDSAAKSLETTVQCLRRLLGDDDRSLVLVSDGWIALDPGRVSSDLAQRRALIKRLEALALAPGSVYERVGLAQRIGALGGGLLLPGAPDAPWLQLERQRCQRDEIRALRAANAARARTTLRRSTRRCWKRACANSVRGQIETG